MQDLKKMLVAGLEPKTMMLITSHLCAIFRFYAPDMHFLQHDPSGPLPRLPLASRNASIKAPTGK